MTASFARPTPAEWRAQAEKALKGRSPEALVHLDADGLAVRPLYAPATEVVPLSAARPSDAEGRAWDLRARVEEAAPEVANAAIITNLEGGAASVLLSGPVLTDSAPLTRTLQGVTLELAAVALDAGFDGPTAADALAVAAKGSPRARLLFHLDPLGAYAVSGGAPRPIEDLVTLAANTAARHAAAYPEARLFLATGRAAHEAGGSAAQELGFAAAAAVRYVEAALAAGLPLDRALFGMALGVSVDAEYFDALSRVRALRLMWRSITTAFGAEAPAMIEARSSRRMLSGRDPWPNLLRLTAAAFAGAVGGADAVVLDGFTRATGLPDAFALRQARNTQLVLMEEAHLGRVDDPASGSWFLDARTRDLAEAGWAEFQRIEREGGLIASLRGSAIQSRIAQTRVARERALSEGQDHLVGVTQFVDPDPRPVAVRPTSAPAGQAFCDTCPALAPLRWSEPFEEAVQ